MPKTFLTTKQFFRRFLDSDESGRIYFDRERPPYALILGAGASRSAGIPLAGEMEWLLAQFASMAKLRIPPRPKRATTLSWYFDRLIPALPWIDEYSDVKYRYEFIRKCIARPRAEPNLTHLIAAHFTVAGLFGPIVTTNFDDQTISGFWHLPLKNSYTEPHVIYDPRAASTTRIIPGVPLVIKAHGHHTIWGTGVLDKEIDELAPHVEQLLDDALLGSDPLRGFLIVGYSGFWNDGVVRVLKRKRKVPIYWCYCGKRPANQNIERIARQNDVRFVKIADSDALFLGLWQEVHSEEDLYRPPLLENYQLFNVERHFPHTSPPLNATWWDVTRVSLEEAAARNHPKLIELRQSVSPILQEIQKQDDEAMFYECLLEVLHPRVAQEKRPLLWGSQLPAIKKLAQALQINFEWTRRNRKLLMLALGTDVDCFLPFEILAGATRW